MPPAEATVLDQTNRVIFSTIPEGVPPEAVAEASRKKGPAGEFEWLNSGDRYVASYWTLFMRPELLNSWVLVQSERKADVVIRAVNEIGLSLSAEKDDTRLLDIILHGAQTVFRADGAGLFLVSPDDRLKLATVRIDSLGFSVGGAAPGLLQELAQLNGADAGALWAASGAMERTLVTPDLYVERDKALAPQLEIDRCIGYHTRSFLSTPLRNHENEVIGILQLINSQAGDRQGIVAFSADDQRLAESLASQAAVALTKSRLVADFRGLFEGMTELISDAIDEKSPYTGGHVRRVVDLAMMIAAAARSSPNETLRAFASSEDALYKLRISALLHDCGKIATPVHIQDKRTKLETIWDRMSLIDTRSEILRRDHRSALLEETWYGGSRTDPART